MPSLLQVLHDATVRGAVEIVLEADRPVQARGPDQVETIATVLNEGELYDALGAVLKPEQQADLAVGNVVEFHLFDGAAKWHLIVEPGGEGVVVRGRAGEAALKVSEVGTPLELPPLRRGEPDRNAAVPRAPGPLLGTKRPRDTAWDLPPVTTSQSGAPLPKPTPRSNPTPPPRGLGSNTKMPSWFETAAPVSSSRAPATSSGAAADESVDFALLRRPPTGEPPAMLDDAIELPEGARPRADDVFGPMARELAPGSVCLVRGHGIGERIARHYGRYALIVAPGEARKIRDDGSITVFVLRIEDPSELLGWSLRRAEEGARVIIETGALTPAGARRSLLGTQGGHTAETWLDALPVHWVTEDDGHWTMTRA